MLNEIFLAGLIILLMAVGSGNVKIVIGILLIVLGILIGAGVGIPVLNLN